MAIKSERPRKPRAEEGGGESPRIANATTCERSGPYTPNLDRWQSGPSAHVSPKRRRVVMRGHGPGPKSVKGRMRPARRRKARPRRVRKTKSAETDRRYRRIDPIGGEYNKGRRAHTNLGADKILLNRFRRTRQSGPCTHVRPSRWKMAARNPSTTPAKKDGRLPTERLLTKPRRSERKRRRTGSRFGMIEERSGRYSASAGTRSAHGSFDRTRIAVRAKPTRN